MLYGDVDLRQVDLAFNDSGRIASVDVQEGDRVKRGEILARLDTSRLEPQVEEAEATAAAQREVVGGGAGAEHRGPEPLVSGHVPTVPDVAGRFKAPAGRLA